MCIPDGGHKPARYGGSRSRQDSSGEIQLERLVTPEVILGVVLAQSWRLGLAYHKGSIVGADGAANSGAGGPAIPPTKRFLNF
jgi:hypothetical protein